MKHLGGVEFSALESDWVELQAHERSHRGDKKDSAGGGTQIIHFSLGFGINRVEVTLFSLLSLGCTAMHFGAPRGHPAETVRFGVVRIRKWATIRGLIRASGRGK